MKAFCFHGSLGAFIMAINSNSKQSLRKLYNRLGYVFQSGQTSVFLKSNQKTATLGIEAAKTAAGKNLNFGALELA